MADSDQYCEGYRACYDGKAPRDNPYKNDDPRNAEWYRGFLSAKRDRSAPVASYG